MDKGAIEAHFGDSWEPFYRRYIPELTKAGEHEHKALCPFHEEKTPSFYVNCKTGAYYCHSCGKKGHAFHLYARLNNLDDRRDFPKILKGIAQDFGIQADDIKPRFIRAYDYTDEAGTLLFQVCRYEPKTFKQRVPDGKGGWRYNLNGTRRVLYNLPEVLKAETVLFLEGEKDVETARELGIPATTSPMGASSWRDEYTESLKGKTVILCPDNDQAGRDFMLKVGASLAGIAKTIKRLDLPGLPAKGDLSDWVQSQTDKETAAERLAVMMAEAPEIERLRPQEIKEAPKPTPAAALNLNFPSDVLRGAAGDFARLYSQYLESPVEFFYFAFLTFLGAVLSGRLTAETELNPQPRFFTLLLGESADDRKSTSISKTAQFFQEALTDGSLGHSWGVGSAEGLAGLFDEEDGGCSRVLLLFDEFKAFVSKCMIEASVLLPCVNTLFESNVFHSRTKNSAITLNGAHLSILGASTIQTFERCWTPAFRDIGFNNRLWLVPGSAQQRFSIPLTIPKAEKSRIRTNLVEILGIVGGGLELPFTLGAMRLYDSWYKTREHSIHTKRLDVYALRLMLLLAVNERKTHIDEDAADCAVRLCDWQLAVRRAYDPIDAESSIARMESEILRQLTRKGSLSKRELQQATNANRVGVWTFDTALLNLAKDGRVFWDESKKLTLADEA